MLWNLHQVHIFHITISNDLQLPNSRQMFTKCYTYFITNTINMLFILPRISSLYKTTIKINRAKVHCLDTLLATNYPPLMPLYVPHGPIVHIVGCAGGQTNNDLGLILVHREHWYWEINSSDLLRCNAIIHMKNKFSQSIKYQDDQKSKFIYG